MAGTERRLIEFNKRYIPDNRITMFWNERHKVFPYIKITNPFKFQNRFPFIRRWLISSCWSWKTLDCLVIELDNGKQLRKFYKDGYYASSTNCELGLADFIRKNYI